MKTYILAALLFSNAIAYAQETRGEAQAIRCGAISFVHTSMSTSNPAFGEAMAQSNIFFSGVFGASRKVRTGLVATNGEVNARRELVLAELKKTWELKPEIVVREAALCNTWRAQFGPRLVAFKDYENEAELVRIVGEPPLKLNAEEVEKWRPIVSIAFAAWGELNKATPSSTRKNIVDSMKKH